MATITNKERAEKCLRLFKQASRMYKYGRYGTDKLTLAKVWNRGMGLLDTITIYPEKRTILVNSALWTRRDEQVLQSILIMRGVGMRKWKRETRYYGYPVYYNHSFGLHLAA